jgi:hypothetical protein
MTSPTRWAAHGERPADRRGWAGRLRRERARRAGFGDLMTRRVGQVAKCPQINNNRPDASQVFPDAPCQSCGGLCAGRSVRRAKISGAGRNPPGSADAIFCRSEHHSHRALVWASGRRRPHVAGGGTERRADPSGEHRH